MIMKRFAVAMALAVVVTFSSVSGSAAATEMPITILNMQKIVKESKAMISIREQVEKEREKLQKMFSKDEEKLAKKQKDLGEKRNLLDAEAFEKERKKFMEELTEVQKSSQKKLAELNKAYGAANEKVQEALADVVNDIAAERKSQVTLPVAQVVYFNKNLDITDEVLDGLNKKLSKVSVDF